MSAQYGVLSTADEALRRFTQLNPDAPVPTVVVHLRGAEPIYFVGLKLAPTTEGEGVAITGTNYALPIYVVRPSEVESVVIGIKEAAPLGFNKGATK